MALVANMPSGRSALLSLEQAETLWHEMGHALHSLLSRTHYQHLSGVPAGRGPLPSGAKVVLPSLRLQVEAGGDAVA